MTNNRWRIFFAAAVLAYTGMLLISCSGGGGSKTTLPVPSIQNINNSTDPSSPILLPLEINGTGFQTSPGQVIFTQGSVTAAVTPAAGGWSDTGIVVTVPKGSSTTDFTLPGTVSVTVKTSGGTSNAVTVSLIQTLTFNVNNVTWAATTALPTPLAGLRAVAVPISDTSAFVVVSGGFDGGVNTANVLSNTLNADGSVGPAWTNISDMPLPAARAHHAMVEADSTNSLVATGSHFVYVIGGQEVATDAPGGTSTVYMASVDSTTGAVGSWTQLSSALPATLVGPSAAIYNGYIYVVGGLASGGTPSANVYSAQVKADGTLGAWSTSGNAYPNGIAFATAFGFGGKLYVIDGDTANSTTPNAQSGTGTSAVNYSHVLNGVVGAWTANSASTIKSRMKHITWNAFGQVIDAEGIYAGNPGSSELERTVVNSDGTLASWNGITSTAQQINANVYNAAAIVSPLQSALATPRFLLFGGQAYVVSGTGTLSNLVYHNTAP